MTELELITKHAGERFAARDTSAEERADLLQAEVESLAHQLLCLKAENRGLRALLELLRGDRVEGVGA